MKTVKVKDQKNYIGIQKIVFISYKRGHFISLSFYLFFPVSIGVDGSGEFGCSSE